MSRLKVLTSCNRIIQSALIEPNTEMLFLTKTRSFVNKKRENWSTKYRCRDIKNCLDDILKYESKEKLPMINEGIKLFFLFFSRHINDLLFTLQ